jgi:transcriptional regulator with XRE-family HTH domain
MTSKMGPRDFANKRLSLGLTQANLRDAMGVAINTITQWENGHRRIPTYAWVVLDLLSRLSNPERYRPPK